MVKAKAEPKTLGERLKALRLRAGLSQADLARRGKGTMPRAEISAIENGYNMGSSWRVRTALAQGFGLPIDVLAPYLDGQLSLEEAARRLPTVARAAPAAVARGALKKHPKLRLAMRLVADDTQFERELIREAAVRLARSEGVEQPDRTALGWVDLLKERVEGLRSEVRLNPMVVPSLATAIGIMVEDNPSSEPELKAIAARLLSEDANPEARTTLGWIRAIDEQRAARAADGARTTPKHRHKPAR